MRSLVALVALVGLPLARAATADWSQVPAILAAISDPKIPAARFAVTEFGGRPDGKTDRRPAIAAAIAKAAAAGGGHVDLSAGTFFCDGPIHLESNIDLHLDEGAVLLFGAEPDRYLPPVLSRYEGTLYYGHSARIEAHGANNISISGKGTIDGNARGTFAIEGAKVKNMGLAGELRKDGADKVPVHDRVFARGRWLRPSLIEPFECQAFMVDGVTLKDSTFWIIHPVLCRNVTVRNVRVDSMNFNNDGCDPDSCSDILIENCDFHTGDDSIAIKSGRDQDGWTVGKPTERLVIRHCLMRSTYSALCIGSEMSGGVRDVFMEDCRVAGSASAFYFKANLDRGGLVEGFRARRISVGDVQESVVRFETSYHGYMGGKFPPSFRDFMIEDLICDRSTAYAVYIEGVDGSPIRDVTLRNFTVTAAKEPVWIRQVEGIHFDHLQVNGIELPSTPSETRADAKKLPINN